MTFIDLDEAVKLMCPYCNRGEAPRDGVHFGYSGGRAGNQVWNLPYIVKCEGERFRKLANHDILNKWRKNLHNARKDLASLGEAGKSSATAIRVHYMEQIVKDLGGDLEHLTES